MSGICPLSLRLGTLGVVALTALASALGCGGGSATVPQTYPVTGRVVFQGGKPLTGAWWSSNP